MKYQYKWIYIDYQWEFTKLQYDNWRELKSISIITPLLLATDEEVSEKQIQEELWEAIINYIIRNYFLNV